MFSERSGHPPSGENFKMDAEQPNVIPLQERSVKHEIKDKSKKFLRLVVLGIALAVPEAAMAQHAHASGESHEHKSAPVKTIKKRAPSPAVKKELPTIKPVGPGIQLEAKQVPPELQAETRDIETLTNALEEVANQPAPAAIIDNATVRDALERSITRAMHESGAPIIQEEAYELPQLPEEDQAHSHTHEHKTPPWLVTNTDPRHPTEIKLGQIAGLHATVETPMGNVSIEAEKLGAEQETKLGFAIPRGETTVAFQPGASVTLADNGKPEFAMTLGVSKGEQLRTQISVSKHGLEAEVQAEIGKLSVHASAGPGTIFVMPTFMAKKDGYDIQIGGVVKFGKDKEDKYVGGIFKIRW